MKKLNEQSLLDLKKKIEKDKTELASLKGRKSGLMDKLKEEWDCDSLADASKKLADIGSQLDKLDETIERSIEELQEKYPELVDG